MGNMSYCRFQNTLADLRDCFDNWEDIDEEAGKADPHSNMAIELKARERMLKLCIQIVKNYADDEVSNALFALGDVLT